MHVSRYIPSLPSGKRAALVTIFLVLIGLLCSFASLQAGTLEDASKALQTQNYREAIRILEGGANKGPAESLLLGRAHYQLGQFEKAAEVLERTAQADPGSAVARMWLGRALGMRAENANPFSAMGLARRARDSFEAAVKADPRNLEAVSDLFSFYLAAPGFLGGGIDKAEALAGTVRLVDLAEYAALRAQLAEKRKDYVTAEKQYLEAQARDAARVGRWIDLAKFYTRRGMTARADGALTKAKLLAPGAPRLLFDEASLLIRAERNPALARNLLRQYTASARRDEDPAPFEVQQLLAKLEKLEKK